MSGGGGTISTSEPRLGAVRIQQSSYGLALPIVYGRTRVGGNLIWYGDFNAIAHTTSSSSGGKGGGGGVTQTNTTYTYEAAIMMALCEGPIGDVVSIWQGKKHLVTKEIPATTGQELNPNYQPWEEYPNYDPNIYIYPVVPAYTIGPLAQLGLSFANGQAGQATWAHLSSNHSAEAIGYSSTAHLYGAKFSLGSNAEISNHSFEIEGKLQFGSGIVDAHPKDIVYDLLTDKQYGALFPVSSMADLSAYSDYCQAAGLFLSPAFTEQQEAREHLKLLTSMTHSACVWSEAKLKIIPYCDEALMGNGATYEPNLTPIYDLTDDDFIVTGAEDPVRSERKTPADAFNQVQIEYLNRSNAYNLEIAEAKDQANIERFGLRPRDPSKMHAICDPLVARRVAQLQLQRSLYVRNEYEFQLGWKYVLLEPMDLVTLTDSGLGLNKTPVRIIDIQEDADGLLTLRAEDYPFGVASVAQYPSQAGSGFAADYNAKPGNVADPVFFEPPIELAAETGLEVWCAVSGQAGPSGDLWGGCHVWASTDGITYKQVGTVRGGARYGQLAATLNTGTGATASVALAGRGGEMLSGTAIDADNKVTLCWVGNSAGGEFMAYQTATLTGGNAYALTGLRRGLYDSRQLARGTTTPFVRVDSAIVKSDPLDLAMIGQGIFFKFCSYNVYGGSLQTLAEVEHYYHVINGSMVKLPPSTVAGLSVAIVSNGLLASWTACPDADYASTLLKVGATWASATLVTQKKSTSHLLQWAPAGQLKVWAVHVDALGNQSTTPVSVTLTIAAPSAPPNLAVGFGTASIEASWSAPAVGTNQQPLDRIELSWGGAFTSLADGKKATTTTFGWLAAGDYTLYARYVDAAGNAGAVSQMGLNVLAPSQPSMTSVETQVNAVTLRWQNAKTSQPIRKYAIYYAEAGTPISLAALYGSAGADSRSDLLFFRSSGAKVAYLVAEDVAGNLSVPRQVDLSIKMPNDFVLATEYYEDWQSSELVNGTIVGGANGQIILPAANGRTWGQRLSNNGWTTAQQKIDAGYPIVLQPVPSSGKHTEQRDLTKVLATAVVRVTPTLQSSVTGCTATIRIRGSVGDSNTSWQPWLTGEAVSISDFQYIEVEYSVTSDGKGFVVLDDLAVKVEITEVTEPAVLVLSASDVGGTVYTCTKPFLDVRTVQATPLNSPGIAKLNCVVDDTFDPPNVYVQAWDTSNNRVSGTVSLYITGV